MRMNQLNNTNEEMSIFETEKSIQNQIDENNNVVMYVPGCAFDAKKWE
jgi:hypothetical protein